MCQNHPAIALPIQVGMNNSTILAAKGNVLYFCFGFVSRKCWRRPWYLSRDTNA